MKYLLFILTLFLLIGCDDGSSSEKTPCNPNPCAEGYTCQVEGDTHQCVSDNPCEPNPCEAGATCEVVGDGHKCVSTDPCNPDPCGFNASCTVDGENYTCTCNEGYELVQHECKLKLTSCTPNPCTEPNQTRCEEISSTKAICLCEEGFELVQVDPYNRICAGSNPCDTDPCKESSDGPFCRKIDTTNFVCYDIPQQSSQVAALYANLGTSTDEELINKLYNLVKDHNSLGYKTASSKMYDIDTKNGKITCAYSNRIHNGSGGLNPEHVWPQSYFGEDSPMKSDLHHLFSVTSFVNSARGNNHFGKVATTSCECLTPDTPWYCTWQDTDSSARKGPVDADKCEKSPQYVFEPVDNIKGDVARALFYFAVRYKDRDINQTQNPGLAQGDPVLKKGNRILLSVEQTLREWHWSDPVDQKELDRNNAIENIQGNRNPFIDRPDLVDRITNF